MLLFFFLFVFFFKYNTKINFVVCILVLHGIVVVVLLFYVHGKHLRSCWDGLLS